MPKRKSSTASSDAATAPATTDAGAAAAAAARSRSRSRSDKPAAAKEAEAEVAPSVQVDAAAETIGLAPTASSRLSTNKSGRWWKATRTEPANAAIRRATPALSSSWARKQAERARQKEFKGQAREHRERQREEREAERKRRAERTKRRAENELKSTVVQPINPEKLKTMNKKQLRMVKKTRIDEDGNLRLVGAYE